MVNDKNMRPMNIAVIGCPVAGKSSFVNTVMTSFSDDCWKERATVGNYGPSAQQVTHNLLGYSKEDYIQSRHNKSYNFPTLIDIAGCDDFNIEVSRELLKIIFSARAKTKYCENEENLKVDSVIVVASAKANPLPRSLLEVAQKEGRVIPLFGILTHKDCIDESDSDFQQKAEGFRAALGITDSRYLLCTNYCDAYDKVCGRKRMECVYPELDIPICDPSRRIVKERMGLEEAIGIAPPARLIPEPGRIFAVLGEYSHHDLMLCAVKVILIAILLFWHLSPGIAGKSLHEDCSKYDQYKGREESLQLSEFEKICGMKYELTQLHLFWPLLLSYLVIVGTNGIRFHLVHRQDIKEWFEHYKRRFY